MSWDIRKSMTRIHVSGHKKKEFGNEKSCLLDIENHRWSIELIGHLMLV